jgi:ribosomal protein L37AE/L43A
MKKEPWLQCPDCNKKFVRKQIGWVCNNPRCINYWLGGKVTVFRFDTGKRVKWELREAGF